MSTSQLIWAAVILVCFLVVWHTLSTPPKRPTVIEVPAPAYPLKTIEQIERDIHYESMQHMAKRIERGIAQMEQASRPTNRRVARPAAEPATVEPADDSAPVAVDPEPETVGRGATWRPVGAVAPTGRESLARDIERTLARYSVAGSVADEVHGPSASLYRIALGDGVKVSAFTALQPELQLALGGGVRCLPDAGNGCVGVEVAAKERTIVPYGSLSAASGVNVPVGVAIDGEALSIDLTAMPHMIVAGTTGSGKSAFLNTVLCGLLQASPDDVQLALIDPKQVEMTPYEDVPHLWQPVASDPRTAFDVLSDLVAEMEERYSEMKGVGVRSFGDYRAATGAPYLVCVIDEFADLIMTNKAVEDLVVRLGQKGRAAGVHVVLATQRPTVNVVTGLIKANFPSRVSFSVMSGTDSRVILDQGGAEALSGKGDGLFLPVGAREPIRFQSAYVTDQEVGQIVGSCWA